VERKIVRVCTAHKQLLSRVPRAFFSLYEGGSFATAGIPWAISSKVEGKELIEGY